MEGVVSAAVQAKEPWIGYNVYDIGGRVYTRANTCHSRREFLTKLSPEILVGAGILRCPAAWAQRLSPTATPGQFEIQKVAADVYFAMAQPWALDNSNAAIFCELVRRAGG